MSRIGKKEIPIPKGVEVKKDGNAVTVKGPKGSLTTPLVTGIDVKVENNVVQFSAPTALAAAAFAPFEEESFSRLDADAIVVPVASSMTCAYTCFRLRNTARRGRSVVPVTLRRMRSLTRFLATTLSFALSMSLSCAPRFNSRLVLHVILSVAKDLRMPDLRPFGCFAASG